jgi:hypothetical protein
VLTRPRLLPVDLAAQQELPDPMPGAHQIHANVLPAANQIAQLLTLHTAQPRQQLVRTTHHPPRRDLARGLTKEDIRVDLMRARHRIGKLRREIYWEEAWSRKHRSWLTSVRFADQASRATMADYLHAHDVLIARRDQVEAELAKLATCAPGAHTVARLRCLRGIDTLTALGLVCRDRASDAAEGRRAVASRVLVSARGTGISHGCEINARPRCHDPALAFR